MEEPLLWSILYHTLDLLWHMDAWQSQFGHQRNGWFKTGLRQNVGGLQLPRCTRIDLTGVIISLNKGKKFWVFFSYVVCAQGHTFSADLRHSHRMSGFPVQSSTPSTLILVESRELRVLFMALPITKASLHPFPFLNSILMLISVGFSDCHRRRQRSQYRQ